jgi:hypothetical protein
MRLQEAEGEPERPLWAEQGAAVKARQPEAEQEGVGKTCLPEAEEERMCLPGVGREAAGGLERRPFSMARLV